MKKYAFLLLTLFVGSFCFSQQQTTNTNYIPIRIYSATFKLKTYSVPTYTSSHKNLNFPHKFNFLTVSFGEINKNSFLISDKNLTTKATKFIYDDYKSYRDENLLKGFLQKYDPTRWDPINFTSQKLN
jgi:hypothetical protein